MRKSILAMALVVPLLGCDGRSKETPVFDQVEIERLLPLNTKGKTTSRDRESVAKLTAFLPELGRGKSSDIAGGWKAAYRLKFLPTQGDPIKITVDSKGELWSEGYGDWRAKTGLKEFLDKWFPKDADKRSEGNWSEPLWVMNRTLFENAVRETLFRLSSFPNRFGEPEKKSNQG